MNSLERKLVELNAALLDMACGKPVNDSLIQQARQSIAGSTPINTGPGNDTVIINQNDHDCNCDCPPGEQGPQGIPGEMGPPGKDGKDGICLCTCNAIVVSSSYSATSTDFYIGVNSENPTTITLPPQCTDCDQIIVKAEMGPPLGNRKVTVTTSDGSLIDDATDYVMEVPYESVQLLCRGGNWHIV
jgi:hypothetical protein